MTTTAMASFSLLSLFCFFLAIVGIGFVGVFATGIVGGILSPSSHRHRAEAEISPSPATWNEQDGEELWVSRCFFLCVFASIELYNHGVPY